MKFVTLLLAALFAAPLWAVVPMPVPEVEPLRRVSVEGFVSVNRNAWAWANEQSAVDIVPPSGDETFYDEPFAKLVFATEREYREELRNDGFVVRVEGVEVCRGSERLLWVESIRTLQR